MTTDQPTDPNRLTLPNEAFDELVAALDQPAQPVPELVELFRRPRVTPPADAYEYETDIEDGPDPKAGDHGTCSPCGQEIVYIDSPYGGWWAHGVHPADGHDAAIGGPA